ncbi:MAG: RES family NAD+ phosphorylase [Gammaproteobacteria bacterium]|uniref:RES family NAD+ phosphorylase n=1 Tax=Hydrogenophaga sp. TaxID=1904254 RepID=UPI0025C45987|nr:RES family NAD+ phosphorylase [Hydrogenophaga sp.]MBU4183237.1 RES family NAD+ phosphorylase [Gammaproteobacteria bacterium]MBU4283124.1 RES family NAD+ phosphorylase [Gammaproteobacteria bacterium]MBU4323480.1 RES family NAD+ phosphorylase [Gammaproteobacteria bacterium]MCG2656513.1 RES family NAD+ phosphorylase [Hydrogenophaga sp.]
MILSLKQTPIIELPLGLIFHRVQLIKPRAGTVKRNRMLLPPAGLLAGRFCLRAGVTAYLADSSETALYESIFRREVRSSVSLEILRLKSIASFSTIRSLRLVDLRGFEERYPFLQSQRIQFTQVIAEESAAAGYDGIFYASSQHPHHDCVCLFERGTKKMRYENSLPLVKSGTDILLLEVVVAARRSAVEVV